MSINAEKFQSATECSFCEQSFIPLSLSTDKREIVCLMVRDHCHLTGNYAREAPSKCIIAVKKLRISHLLFHTLSSSDNHLFCDTRKETKREVRFDVSQRLINFSLILAQVNNIF